MDNNYNNQWNPNQNQNGHQDFNEQAYKNQYNLNQEKKTDQKINNVPLSKAQKRMQRKAKHFILKQTLRYGFLSIFFAVFIFCFMVLFQNASSLFSNNASLINYVPFVFIHFNFAFLNHLNHNLLVYLLIACGFISWVICISIANSIRNHVWLDDKKHYIFKFCYWLISFITLIVFLFIGFLNIYDLDINFILILKQHFNLTNYLKIFAICYFVSFVWTWSCIGLYFLEYYFVCIIYTILKNKQIKKQKITERIQQWKNN